MKRLLIMLGVSFIFLVGGCASDDALKQAESDNNLLREELSAKNNQIIKLESEVKSLERALSNKQSELEITLQANQDLNNTLNLKKDELLDKINQLSSEKVSIEKDLVYKNGELEKMKSDYDSLVDEYNKTKSQNDENLLKVAKLEGENSRILTENAGMKEDIEGMNKQIFNLELAKDRLVEMEQYNNRLKGEIGGLQDEIDRLNKENDSLSNSNIELSETLLSKAEQLSTRLANIIKEKQTLEAELNKLRKESEEQKKMLENENKRMEETYQQAMASLKEEIDRGEIVLERYKSVLTFNMADRIFFDSGKAVLKKEGMNVLDKIATIIKKLPEKLIRVEGHTDNVPISKALKDRYPTNWELSAARAINVVRYLQDKNKVDPLRLIPVAYGEYKPIASNKTVEGKAKNRRIEILIVDKKFYEMMSAQDTQQPLDSSENE